MNIKLDDLTHPAIAALLQEHLDDMYATSPPECVHALDLNALRQPRIQFFSIWQDEALLGCGALKKLSDEYGEIKSMRTARQHIRKGVAAKMLAHIIQQAKYDGLKILNLETGSQAFFEPAIALYQGFGFTFCGPFSDYKRNPNSKFMELILEPRR